MRMNISLQREFQEVVKMLKSQVKCSVWPEKVMCPMVNDWFQFLSTSLTCKPTSWQVGTFFIPSSYDFPFQNLLSHVHDQRRSIKSVFATSPQLCFLFICHLLFKWKICFWILSRKQRREAMILTFFLSPFLTLFISILSVSLCWLHWFSVSQIVFGYAR